MRGARSLSKNSSAVGVKFHEILGTILTRALALFAAPTAADAPRLAPRAQRPEALECANDACLGTGSFPASSATPTSARR